MMSSQARLLNTIFLIISIGCAIAVNTLEQLDKYSGLIQQHPTLAFVLNKPATIAFTTGVIAALLLLFAVIFANFVITIVAYIPFCITIALTIVLFLAEHDPNNKTCLVYPHEHDVRVYLEDNTESRSPGYVPRGVSVKVVNRNANRQDEWYLIEMSPQLIIYPGYESRRNVWLDAGLVVKNDEIDCVDIPISPEK